MSWTSPTVRTTGELITAAIWNTDLVANLSLLKTPIDDGGNLAPTAASTLTLATDACTPTQNLHKVDTEAAAATDNLSTLTISGSIRAGHLLILMAANVAHVVTVTDGVGNIVLRGGAFVMDNANKFLLLTLVGTTWYEVCRSSPRGGDLAIVSKSAIYTMTDADDVVLANGTFTITLPSVSATPRRPRTVKNVGTGVITVAPASGLIDGAASQAVNAQYDSLTVVPDGTNWFNV